MARLRGFVSNPTKISKSESKASITTPKQSGRQTAGDLPQSAAFRPLRKTFSFRLFAGCGTISPADSWGLGRGARRSGRGRQHLVRKLGLAFAMSLALGAVAHADPLEGNWKTSAGSTAGIAACGGSFCIKLKTGSHAGKSIGKLKADGGNSYSGTITDPSNDKTYSGKASLSGKSLKLSGCVFGGLLCKSQTWTKL